MRPRTSTKVPSSSRTSPASRTRTTSKISCARAGISRRWSSRVPSDSTSRIESWCTAIGRSCSTEAMARPPEHVFVLMLENRSFDHMLGFSGLTGGDAETGGAAAIDGLTGGESNAFGGVTYPVVLGADYVMPADPGHDFSFVLDQLCGPAARYAPPYPPVDGSGFVDSYSRVSGPATAGVVMRCFDTPRQLPVLHALAREYAVCDRWFSSMPGPTAPNRMFVHAGSSGGLDHSPTTEDVVEWETID